MATASAAAASDMIHLPLEPALAGADDLSHGQEGAELGR
jgi:hypothetical protein